MFIKSKLIWCFITFLSATVIYKPILADADSHFENFSIVGDSSVIIGNGSKIIAGTGSASVCSNGTLTLGRSSRVRGNSPRCQSINNMIMRNGTKFYGTVVTNGILSVGVSSYIDGSVNAYGNVMLRDGARINGEVTTAGKCFLGTKASINGTITEDGNPEKQIQSFCQPVK